MTNTANQIDIEIGRNLKRARHAQGLSQTNIGNMIGVTFQQVQKYETGVNRIAASRLVEIAQALKVDIKELLPSFSKPQVLHDPTLTKQSKRLIQLFHSIPAAGMRATILRLVQDIASKAGSS
jgi:transcriptional regulator with XRE-family HTH domain